MLGVVGYGGGLWHTWFDRDLGLAGRVLVRHGESGRLRSMLVRVDKPIARIPNLAIHLTTPDERGKGFQPNLQTQAPPLLATALADALWNEKHPAGSDAVPTADTTCGKRHHPALVSSHIRKRRIRHIYAAARRRTHRYAPVTHARRHKYAPLGAHARRGRGMLAHWCLHAGARSGAGLTGLTAVAQS
jgi:hypothetical protein